MVAPVYSTPSFLLLFKKLPYLKITALPCLHHNAPALVVIVLPRTRQGGILSWVTQHVTRDIQLIVCDGPSIPANSRDKKWSDAAQSISLPPHCARLRDYLESLNTAITDNFPDYVPISLVFAGPAVHWSRVVITAARRNPVKLWAAVTDYVFMTIWSLETLSAATVTNPPWLLIIPFDYQWLDEICQTNECYDYIRNLEVGDFPCVCWR